MICLHASIGQCSWIAPSHTTITFFPIFSNSTIKSISLFSFWTLKTIRDEYVYTDFYKIAINKHLTR